MGQSRSQKTHGYVKREPEQWLRMNPQLAGAQQGMRESKPFFVASFKGCWVHSHITEHRQARLSSNSGPISGPAKSPRWLPRLAKSADRKLAPEHQKAPSSGPAWAVRYLCLAPWTMNLCWLDSYVCCWFVVLVCVSVFLICCEWLVCLLCDVFDFKCT